MREEVREELELEFETAVLSGVLHHVAPRARVELLRSVRELLRPGVRLFVFEHNPLNPVTRQVVAACAFDGDAIHLWPWQARRALASAGFEAIERDYIVFFSRVLARLRPLEPRLRGVMLGAQQMLIGTRR